MLLVVLLAIGCSSAPVGEDRSRQLSSREGRPTAAEAQPVTTGQGPSATAELPPTATTATATTRPSAAPKPRTDAPAPLSPAAARLVAQRPYQLLRPARVAPDERLPLVVYLHGLGSSARQLLGTLELRAFTDSQRVLIAAPNGSRDSLGRRFWNASSACCDFDGRGVDDVAYLTALIDDVQGRAQVDPKRIYLVGYSNGGFMAYRLACELGPRIAAVAVFSGALPVDAECGATGPVSVLHVHGDADRVVRYTGGRVLSLSDRAPHRGAAATLAPWAALNGCSPELQTLASGSRQISDQPIVVQRHPNCRDGAVELWTVRGGGHLIGMSRADIAATFRFLLSHSKP